MDFSKIVNKIKGEWSKLESIDKIFIVFLLVSFVTRLISLMYPVLRGWDESVYLNLGKDLSHNPFVYSLKNSGWSDFIPSSDLVYGWPNIGFRAPLLPYVISLFYSLKLSIFVPIIIPFVTTLSVLLVYNLGGLIFNKRVGLYSAVIFSFVPIHLFCSGKILTDAFVVFFILLTFISFWKGYEKGNKKHKILFGLFLALSLMARYTTLWIVPVFLFYFIVRDKSLKILKDKYLWFSIGVFILVLIPWFIYGYIYYGNPLGGFIHGFKAAAYWGGVQSWKYFFQNSWRIFSITGIFFAVSLIYLFLKKEFLKKEFYLIFIWLFFFSTVVMLMPHKEDRFIMPVVPVICLISGLFIDKLGKVKNIIFGLIFIFLIFSFYNSVKIDYQYSKDKASFCYFSGNDFIKNNLSNEDSVVVSNQNPITHYYSGKDTIYYPSDLSLLKFKDNFSREHSDKKLYLFFANYEMSMDSEIKKDLDSNFNKIFECSSGSGYSAVYK